MVSKGDSQFRHTAALAFSHWDDLMQRARGEKAAGVN
jgi:hypothetical protein